MSCLAGMESESEVAQSCPTLCDSMDCSPPGFSIHGVFQARILEWVAIMEAPLSPAAAWASGEWRNDRHSYCGGRYLDMISAYAGSTSPTHLVVGLTGKLNNLD